MNALSYITEAGGLFAVNSECSCQVPSYRCRWATSCSALLLSEVRNSEANRRRSHHLLVHQNFLGPSEMSWRLASHPVRRRPELSAGRNGCRLSSGRHHHTLNFIRPKWPTVAGATAAWLAPANIAPLSPPRGPWSLADWLLGFDFSDISHRTTLVKLWMLWTGCATKMYPLIPLFESKWFITFSKLGRDFYTIIKKMKCCTGLYKLQLPNVKNFDAVRSSKWPAKNSLCIAISYEVQRSKGVCTYPVFESK